MQKIEPSEYRAIAKMRRDGASLQSIGNRYGVSRERIRQIVAENFPEVNRAVNEERDERNRQLRVCPDCGGPKAISAQRCRTCRTKRDTKWTQDEIIAAMQEFHRRYGKTPSCTEWNPSLARWRKQPDVAEKFAADGCWPSVQTVMQRFGSWTAAVDAAGLPRNRAGRPARAK